MNVSKTQKSICGDPWAATNLICEGQEKKEKSEIDTTDFQLFTVGKLF